MNRLWKYEAAELKAILIEKLHIIIIIIIIIIIYEHIVFLNLCKLVDIVPINFSAPPVLYIFIKLMPK
jgi:hypothetical protein